MSTNINAEAITNLSHQEAHTEGHVHRDDYGSKLGMWLFLFTELLLFGGLFVLYMAYRHDYFPMFQLGAKELKIYMGGLNTLVLLTSSLTMVLSITALQRKSIKGSIFWLLTTIFFAFGFLIIKFLEWSEKYHHGLFPKAENLLNQPEGVKVFFGLYYTMTGLHGIHVIIGILILSYMVIRILNGKVTPDKFVPLENAGLYWHLVDLIWIFLFPLFYLLH
ncbi:MAG TPA: cytochrome c oxidase subunit 3 [Candidatus Kapabacteria bacterium]|nr:cytochrome c oxidase subunit 3 [Candidatus Kapabacteria bacterium]